MVCNSGFAVIKNIGYFTLLDCKLVGQSVVAERIKSLSFHLGTYPRSNASGLKRLAWLWGFAGQFQEQLVAGCLQYLRFVHLQVSKSPHIPAT